MSGSTKRGTIGFRGVQGVADDVFEDVDVLKEPGSTRGGEAAEGLRSVVLIALPDLDEPGLMENLKVSTEVAVSQGAQILEVGEDQSLGVSDQRRENSQSRLLVEDAF